MFMLMSSNENYTQDKVTLYTRDTGLNFRPYIIINGANLSDTTTTTSITSTSTTIEPTAIQYIPNATSGVLGGNFGVLGDSTTAAKYLIGLFILGLYAWITLTQTDSKVAILTSFILAFVLSIIGLLPIAVAFVFIIVAVVFVAKEIFDII
jgi:hypothetical protein